MELSDFDYKLPKNLIAQIPLPIRDQSRLMIVDRITSTIQIDVFSHLPLYLPSKPTLIFNNTQVIPAKLFAKKSNEEKPIEILLVRELQPGVWEAMIKGLAKLKTKMRLTFPDSSLSAILQEKRHDRGIIKFFCQEDLKSTLNRIGYPPLPPYIRRDLKLWLDEVDRYRYQNVFAEKPGAIAAPTAGLHFTKELLETLRVKGLETLFLTLHIGPGTFQPVRVTDCEKHKMEAEKYYISKKIWNRLVEIKLEKKPLLAVGTSSVRTLESVALNSITKKNISGWTQLFIHPGYHFKNVDHILTNFHIPKSTLFMLVSAFGGLELIKKAYQIAIKEKFRFYSYGDSMLIL